ncbi:AMP-binding protein [Rhodococcus sp. NPDC047139]|uniref:AMP-dependent synthetase/ligase n=1 Tax=Rhodococcus sp. NPDC047139 TaxID=3155141 RepID=UPI0033C419CB
MASPRSSTGNAADSRVRGRSAATVPDLLLDRVARSPEAVAYLRPEGGHWRPSTWSEVRERVFEFAAGLIARGVEPGMRVAICATTCYRSVVADLAIACAGGVTVPIYPGTHDEEARSQIQRAHAVLTIADRPVPTAPLQRLDRLGELVTQGRRLLRSEPDAVDRRIAACSPDDQAALVYTACENGRTKGACLTHGGTTYGARAVAQTGMISSSDLQLLWLPLAHVFGRSLLLMAMHAGASTALDGRADRVVANLRKVHPTFLGSVPHVLEKIARLERHQLGGRLRFVISGSARLPREIADRLEQLGVPVLEGYGITETSGPSCVNLLGARRPGTVGRPLHGTKIRIADTGELLVRSPGVMTGYDDDPAETAAVLDADGWFHTGDLAGVDADGFVTVTGHRKNTFKTSTGKYVGPAALADRWRRMCPGSELVVAGELRPYCTGLVFTTAPDAVVAAAVEQFNERSDPWERIRRFVTVRIPLDSADLDSSGRPIRDRLLTHYSHLIDELYTQGCRAGQDGSGPTEDLVK